MRWLRCLLCASIVLMVWGTVDVAYAREKVPVPSTGAYIGMLTSMPGLSNSESMARRESQFSRTFAIDSRYFDWGDGFPASSQTWDAAGGRIPMITWWWPQHYSDITDGSQDSYIRARAQAVKAFGSPVFLRPAAEMNGDWFDWGGAENGEDTAGFIRAWRRIHDIFASEGADNVSWVWSPNSESSPGGWASSSWNNWRNYYPGDAYVDWVGIDGYNWGSLPGGDGWLPVGGIMTPVFDDYASRKPIMIAETGSTESGGDKAQWIGGLGTWVKAHPAVKAVVWFDRTYTSTGHDWAIDTSSASTAAFGRLAADPYFRVLAASAHTTPPKIKSSPASRNVKVDVPPPAALATTTAAFGARVFARKVQRQRRRVSVKVKLRADRRVAAWATGEVRLGRSKLRLSARKQRIGAGKRATLTLTLKRHRDNPKVVSALERHHKVKAAVRVRFTDKLGNRAGRRVVIRLR